MVKKQNRKMSLFLWIDQNRAAQVNGAEAASFGDCNPVTATDQACGARRV